MAPVRNRGGDVGCLTGRRRKSRNERAPPRTESRSEPLSGVLKSKRRIEGVVREALLYFDCADDGLSGVDSVTVRAAVVSTIKRKVIDSATCLKPNLIHELVRGDRERVRGQRRT